VYHFDFCTNFIVFGPVNQQSVQNKRV